MTNPASKPESKFPTLRDFRDRISELVDEGFGDFPAQILVLPDSTMQALAGHFSPKQNAGAKPALMIELDDGENGKRSPVCVVNVDRMGGGGMPTTRSQ